MNFKTYLQQSKLSPSTIHGHLKVTERYKGWCSAIGTQAQAITYNDLLLYIRAQQDAGHSRATINIHLNSITKYNNWLVVTGQRHDNPAMRLRVKKQSPKLTRHILSFEQLESLYKAYRDRQAWEFNLPISTLVHKRNVVILGLMVYQGLHSGELMKLEPGHINIRQCKIYIPATKRGNSRTLPLHAPQVLPLQEYLGHVREKLIKAHHKDTGKLFTGNGYGCIQFFLKKLKERYPQVKSPEQVRTSIIIHWLKQYNLRQVQYMCGHRHISSTERYRQQDVSDLQQQLSLFHPMNK